MLARKCTDLLILSPAAPPTDPCHCPALANWCKHEPILCPPTLKAVCGEGATDSSSHHRLIDPLLDSIVGELLTRLHDAVHSHGWKYAVVWIQLALVVVYLEPPHPDGEPEEAVHTR